MFSHYVLSQLLPIHENSSSSTLVHIPTLPLHPSCQSLKKEETQPSCWGCVLPVQDLVKPCCSFLQCHVANALRTKRRNCSVAKVEIVISKQWWGMWKIFPQESRIEVGQNVVDQSLPHNPKSFTTFSLLKTTWLTFTFSLWVFPRGLPQFGPQGLLPHPCHQVCTPFPHLTQILKARSKKTHL